MAYLLACLWDSAQAAVIHSSMDSGCMSRCMMVSHNFQGRPHENRFAIVTLAKSYPALLARCLNVMM